MPAVSILMPVRDAAATLPAAVESLRAQEEGDWELVAVDDGSSDGSGEWLDGQAARDHRVRVLHPGRVGIARALNIGLQNIRAPLVARMDADDLMHPARLGEQCAWLAANPHADLVSCLVCQGNKGGAGYAAHVDWINSLCDHRLMSLRRFVDAPVAHPSVVFRRATVEKHGGYRDGDFPEDFELWLRWLGAGAIFGKVEKELLVWNDSPGRLSRVDPRYSPGAFHRIKAGYLAAWLRENVPPEKPVLLWGAGRVTRRRFDALEAAGIPIAGFIDIDPAKWGRHRDGRQVIGPDALPPPGAIFVLAGVGNRGAREAITRHLEAHGHAEGRDFLLAG